MEPFGHVIPHWVTGALDGNQNNMAAELYFHLNKSAIRGPQYVDRFGPQLSPSVAVHDAFTMTYRLLTGRTNLAMITEHLEIYTSSFSEVVLLWFVRSLLSETSTTGARIHRLNNLLKILSASSCATALVRRVYQNRFISYQIAKYSRSDRLRRFFFHEKCLLTSALSSVPLSAIF